MDRSLDLEDLNWFTKVYLSDTLRLPLWLVGICSLDVFSRVHPSLSLLRRRTVVFSSVDIDFQVCSSSLLRSIHIDATVLLSSSFMFAMRPLNLCIPWTLNFSVRMLASGSKVMGRMTYRWSMYFTHKCVICTKMHKEYHGFDKLTCCLRLWNSKFQSLQHLPLNMWPGLMSQYYIYYFMDSRLHNFYFWIFQYVILEIREHNFRLEMLVTIHMYPCTLQFLCLQSY